MSEREHTDGWERITMDTHTDNCYTRELLRQRDFYRRKAHRSGGWLYVGQFVLLQAVLAAVAPQVCTTPVGVIGLVIAGIGAVFTFFTLVWPYREGAAGVGE